MPATTKTAKTVKAKIPQGLKQRIASSLTYQFMLAISQGDGYAFSAKDIHSALAKEYPEKHVSKVIQGNMGALFRKMQRLNLIYASNELIDTQRNGNALCRKWIVGRPPNGQLKVKFDNRGREQGEPSGSIPPSNV